MRRNSSPGWTETAPDSGVFELIIGQMQVGETRQALFGVISNPVLVEGQDDLYNTVSIADNGTNGSDQNDADNTSEDSTPVLAFPDYSVTKANDITMASPTDLIDYQISATNSGTQFGSNVVITDTYWPDILNVVDADGGVVDAENGTITWIIPLLAVGQVEDFNIVMQVRPDAYLTDAEQLFTNNIVITDDGANGEDPNLDNNSDSETDMLLANQGEPLILAGTPITAPATPLTSNNSTNVAGFSADRFFTGDGANSVANEYLPRFISNATMNSEGVAESNSALANLEDSVLEGGDLLDNFMFDVNLCQITSEGTACATDACSGTVELFSQMVEQESGSEQSESGLIRQIELESQKLQGVRDESVLTTFRKLANAEADAGHAEEG